jgi:hypothetical protein
MGKERQSTKESKKPATMSLKEKRQAKKNKKDAKGSGSPILPR